jgi:hypothetical protein
MLKKVISVSLLFLSISSHADQLYTYKEIMKVSKNLKSPYVRMCFDNYFYRETKDLSDDLKNNTLIDFVEVADTEVMKVYRFDFLDFPYHRRIASIGCILTSDDYGKNWGIPDFLKDSKPAIYLASDDDQS